MYLYRRQGLVWFDTAVDCEQLSFQLLCRLGAGCSSAMVQWSAGASLWLVQRGWSSVGAEWAPRQLDAGSSESSPAATYLLNFSISGAVQIHISNSSRLWESYLGASGRPVKVPCFWFSSSPLHWKHLNHHHLLNHVFSWTPLWQEHKSESCLVPRSLIHYCFKNAHRLIHIENWQI